MSTSDATMQALAARFDPAAAAGLDLTFGFNVTDEDKQFSLTVKDGTCSLQEGANPDANATLVLDADTLKSIQSGSSDGTQEFTAGRLRIEGDPIVAQKLGTLFPA
ncbi:SCP-2 sterol transfer family protein [Streptomyces camponoticapitis]|uniref:SCP-2 sterol transfer family protein n=1 Tax=Streptomyces camponoticapitis TaxID=1616125 RepID=A0ABQ2E0T0_9ACTN|nr:SCP2 sterol-binding domain-containing protein [Streptomyces camponoticapitis]GGJ80693.1 SCP-2 sterol transfer family protein [Streptomyces camponoticapitis]